MSNFVPQHQALDTVNHTLMIHPYETNETTMNEGEVMFDNHSQAIFVIMALNLLQAFLCHPLNLAKSLQPFLLYTCVIMNFDIFKHNP